MRMSWVVFFPFYILSTLPVEWQGYLSISEEFIFFNLNFKGYRIKIGAIRCYLTVKITYVILLFKFNKYSKLESCLKKEAKNWAKGIQL